VLDNELLRYKYLGAFDAAMNKLEAARGWLAAPQAYVSLKHEGDKVVAFERAGLLFVFNFHPAQSFTDYRVGVEQPGPYRIVLSTDDKAFGGFANVDTAVTFETTAQEWCGRKNYVQVRGRRVRRRRKSVDSGGGSCTSRPGRRSSWQRFEELVLANVRNFRCAKAGKL
jgi:1,4-alpha-glucan branching enzyme